MPVAGAGGFLSNLFFPGLDDRLAQHITPNPSPLAQQGGPAAPGSVDQLGNPVPSGPPPSSNLPPPAVTAPDPANAANVAALTQPSSAYARDAIAATRRDAMAAGLNQGFGEISAGFGTAQQQQSKQNALARGGGVGSSLADLASIQAMQDKTITDNENARFQANAAVFAQTLSQSLGRPVSVAEAQELMANPKALDAVTTAMGANATTTSTQKDAEAATRAWAAANPKATPQQIADYKANLIAGGMGGSDLEQREYLNEKRNGLTQDDFATWKGKKAAEAAGAVATQKEAADFKNTAVTDYTSVNSKLTKMQTYVDTLKKDPLAAKAALATFLPTTGKWGALMPGAAVPDNVKAAAVALQTIQSELKAEGLSGVKNVRNINEFNTLGQAATGGLDPAASDANFTKAIDMLNDKFLDTKATSELAAGHKLTGELIGHGNGDLLEPTINGKANPYYNGGSEDAQKLTGDDLKNVQQALTDHPERREEILAQVRKNGYSPRGLY